MEEITITTGNTRIIKTCEAFKQAIKLSRLPKRCFDCAKFLQESNQYRPAEILYTEALTLYRTLAKGNPAVYLPYVAMVLNNLGNLMERNSQRYSEADVLYTEAFDIFRMLAKGNPALHPTYMADTLNNLGNLVANDSQRFAEAEALYTDALTFYRALAQEDDEVYLPYVADTLNSLGNLVANDSQRFAEAEALYTDALSLYRSLVRDFRTNMTSLYLPYVAGMLDNLGNLVKQDSQRCSEADALHSQAMDIRRTLAKGNPDLHPIDVANTLNGMGHRLAKQDNLHRSEAETLLTAALRLARLLAQDNYVAGMLYNLGNLVKEDGQRRSEAEALYTEALDILRTLAKGNPALYLPSVAKMLDNLRDLEIRQGGHAANGADSID